MPQQPRSADETSDQSFLVVGIGASAGGLEAVTELISELAPTTAMAFVLVQHLDPNHESLLTEILARKANIRVETAAEGALLRPGILHVIPPNTALSIADGALKLAPRESGDRPHKPVNILFRSLAEQYSHRAVGIILSGTDSDGTEGLEEIKAAGGIAMAQEPASAKFDGMPKSAIATGCVDFVLPPSELGKELVRIARHPYLNSASGNELAQQQEQLRPIFRLLHSQTGTDFSHYKKSTIQRRLVRRMALRQMHELAEYAELLNHDPEEINALAQDFLIRVTGFFRDPETYQGLIETVLPVLLDGRSAKEPLRIWVPGCASGEEVYSIAILFLEYLAKRDSAIRIQIFGTDLSELAIAKARAASYADNIVDEISPERLQRFFVKLDGRYQVSKMIRELCVFAKHDLTRDPPFSRIDLLSCRNLLIYLDQALQRRIIALLHYSLNPTGFLILGPSETVGRDSELFTRAAGSTHIFRRQPSITRATAEFAQADAAGERIVAARPEEPTNPGVVETDRAQKETERLLLTRFAPAAILVDEALNAVYFQGETSRYLEHARGSASLNLQKICRPDLLVAVSPLIQEAQQSGRPALRQAVKVQLSGEEQEIGLEVQPVKLPGIASHYSLILFRHSQQPPQTVAPGWLSRLWSLAFGSQKAIEIHKDTENARLQHELEAARAYLQTIAEEHEAIKEEMKSAHEEALSANEEFVSTNEELETAKEELQSSNEELGITNQELRDRNRELDDLNDDLRGSQSHLDAIIETLRESLLVLDADLRVEKANHAFYEMFQVGAEQTLTRRLYDLGDGQWNIPALRELLERILPEDQIVRDFEVMHDFPTIGNRNMLLNARRLVGSRTQQPFILLAIEDITERQSARRKLLEADARKNNFLANPGA